MSPPVPALLGRWAALSGPVPCPQRWADTHSDPFLSPPLTPFLSSQLLCTRPSSTFRPQCCEVLGLRPVTGVPRQTRVPRAVRGWGRKPGSLPGGVQPQLSWFSSVTQSCPTLWDPMNCSMPGFPVDHQLPECAQTHVQQLSYEEQNLTLKLNTHHWALGTPMQAPGTGVWKKG